MHNLWERIDVLEAHVSKTESGLMNVKISWWISDSAQEQPDSDSVSNSVSKNIKLTV